MASHASDFPFHMLMLGNEEKEQQQRIPQIIGNDYLARRHARMRRARSSTGNKAEEKQHIGEEDSLWAGATPLERAMVGCCDSDIGALAKGKEILFLGLVVRFCNDAASQALALAILQRTVDATRPDEDESSEEEDYESVSSEEEEAQGEKPNGTEGNVGQNGKLVVVKEDKAHAEVQLKNEEERISSFLAAGGLLTLSHWLVDSTTPTLPEESSQAETKKNPYWASAPNQSNPPTGPILIPLLSLLESIPFHKRLVTETKINKSIRNVKRKLDEAVANRSSQINRDVNTDSSRLEGWRHPVAGGNVVVEVQEAIDSLMQTWQEEAKETNSEPVDPFASLREKLRLSLEAMKNDECQSAVGDRAEKSPMKEKLSAHELEALEHKKERQRIQEALQRTQKEKQEAKEKLEQLRRRLKTKELKRKADDEQSSKHTRSKVQWKDGLTNDTIRRRKLLESVHVYPREGDEESTDRDVNVGLLGGSISPLDESMDVSDDDDVEES